MEEEERRKQEALGRQQHCQRLVVVVKLSPAQWLCWVVSWLGRGKVEVERQAWNGEGLLQESTNPEGWVEP